MKPIAILMFLAISLQASDYSTERASVDGFEVIRLKDAARRIEISIVPKVGNLAYEMRVNGKNIFWKPDASLGDIQKNATLCGNPFLAPWANRVDGDAYWVNGKLYHFNPDLGNLRRDPNGKPIHGLLAFSPAWEMVEEGSNAGSAWVISRLEYGKHPGLMAQFPFSHTIEMVYRLKDGVLEVETILRNHSLEPMPVAVGYHPYFEIHDAPRDDWRVHVAARERYELTAVLVPTGDRTPIALADPYPLRGSTLDDVFGALVRGADGQAHFWVQGREEKISVHYGPKYPVAIIYAPPGRNFICFEPMAAVTNAFNLAHAGKYKELQTVPPGGEWRESYWIEPTGF